MPKERVARQQQILEALASELETNCSQRITTARLARVVGVSEAALYRHFPSKAKMFEALIEFAEESIFGRYGVILAEELDGIARCEQMLTLLLAFSERNPGITRILLGDALVGENKRLQDRVRQFFNRLETQIKQVLREEEQRRSTAFRPPISVIANLLLAVVEGRMTQFARSLFAQAPTTGWVQQWNVLALALFERCAPGDAPGAQT
jgi:TetR/AcrR family transcriptional regulator